MNENETRYTFNVKQVAQLYRVTVQTVHRWIQTGRLETVRTPGGRLRVIVGPSALGPLEAMVAEDR